MPKRLAVCSVVLWLWTGSLVPFVRSRVGCFAVVLVGMKLLSVGRRKCLLQVKNTVLT